MMKGVFSAAALLMVSWVSAGQLVIVSVGHSLDDPTGLAGEYLLVRDKKGMVSLDPIKGGENLPEVGTDGIVPALEKIHPSLAGMIKVSELSFDTGKLANDGKVHVFGQVKNAGDQPAAKLGECIALAKPTDFGAVIRIEVVRGRQVSTYDLRDNTHAEAKLEPGDIVRVPMRSAVGR